MPRKTKHPKLPNGFGCIKKLSGNRSNPYGVYPPTTEFAPNGSPITPKAICYAPDWYTAFFALLSWRNGTFDPELAQTANLKDTDSPQEVAARIIAAYNSSVRQKRPPAKTFSQVYEEFYEYKYTRDKTRTYSAASRNSTKAAYKNCAMLHNRPFQELKTEDLQEVVDNCPLKHASKELICSLFKQMYAYADAYDLCDKDYSVHVRINTMDDDEKGIPFSQEEIDLIWQHASENRILQSILIMIYSGFRISAYRTMEVNMEKRYFRGGVKTAAGKNRLVPFCPLIEGYVKPNMELFQKPPGNFRTLFSDALASIGITGHTPHDARHTFSWLCDKYKVDPLTKKMLLGHSRGNDVTDAKYGHRTENELRAEISKIRHW